MLRKMFIKHSFLRGENLYVDFLATVSNQLLEILLNLGNKNIVDNLIDSSTEGSGFFSFLLQKISDRLAAYQSLIITIDGCDRVPAPLRDRIDINQQPRGANIFYLPRYLPEKVYFILTRRPFLSDKSGLLIETPAQYLDLADYPEQNQADIQEYIKNNLNYTQIINEQLLTKISKDETNFMYVSEILANRNLPNDNLPQNLQNYYQSHWQKMNSAMNQQQSIALQVLNILSQDNKPISVEKIAETLDEDEYEINLILDKWREFLDLETISGQVYYRFYHNDFCNWLKK
ncbi:MAG: ATP-binding protein [Moorea sp. SIO2B7]|nr:ATP-binding protein [Moorena sp. SIO2B7]